jgi:hypothetical protein
VALFYRVPLGKGLGSHPWLESIGIRNNVESVGVLKRMAGISHRRATAPNMETNSYSLIAVISESTEATTSTIGDAAALRPSAS